MVFTGDRVCLGKRNRYGHKSLLHNICFNIYLHDYSFLKRQRPNFYISEQSSLLFSLKM